MAGTVEERLAAMGIALPDPRAPAANYVPFVQSGSMLYVSGQISQDGSGLITGRLTAADHAEGPPPPGSNLAKGVGAARACAINLIAQAKAATGDLERIGRVVKLTAFVNSAADFTMQPQVVNGCSDLMVEAFGEAGRHARSAVGVAALPLGVMVEVEGIFELA